MNAMPTELERISDKELRITWSDGQIREYSVRELRDSCPCATCREKRKQTTEQSNILPIFPPEEARPLAITGMKPVGNYAYSIAFTDGHDTGIYSFDFLREHGEVTEKK